jgi:hypothetical protein
LDRAVRSDERALKLCGALGIDACELGAPILSEELDAYEKRQ